MSRAPSYRQTRVKMTAKKKVAITAIAIATQITGLTPNVYARDFGQYNDVPDTFAIGLGRSRIPEMGEVVVTNQIVRAPMRGRMEMPGKPVPPTEHG